MLLLGNSIPSILLAGYCESGRNLRRGILSNMIWNDEVGLRKTAWKTGEGIKLFYRLLTLSTYIYLQISDSQEPSDQFFLGLIGKSLEGGVAQVIVSSAFYGIFLLLFSVSVVTFMLRKTRNSASYVIFGTTIFTFLVATLDLFGRILSIYLVTSVTLRDERGDLLLMDKVASANERLVYPNIIAEWTTSSATMISDCVVICRLWTVIPEQRYRATVVPIAFFIFSIGLTLAYLIKISSPEGIMGVFFVDAPYILFALSMAANVITTSIFGFKLWRFRRFLTQNGVLNDADVSGTRKQLEKILLLLIESGLIYCVIQIVYLVLGFVGTTDAPGRLGRKIYDVFYFSISVVYPTLVVVLVTTQRSLADNIRKSRDGERSARAATQDHLSFAVAASSKHTDLESQAGGDSPFTQQVVIAQEKGVIGQTRSAPA